MVLTYERGAGEAAICSAWGPNSDWVRNLRVAPAVEVRLGRQSFVPEQRFLTDNEGIAVAFEFRRRHPYRLRLLSGCSGGAISARTPLSGTSSTPTPSCRFDLGRPSRRLSAEPGGLTMEQPHGGKVKLPAFAARAPPACLLSSRRVFGVLGPSWP